MSKSYRGGAVYAPVPPGELTEIRLGQRVDVYSVYQRLVVRTGEVVYIIEPGTVPVKMAMDTLFARNKQATALKQYPAPTRASKYRRVIIQNNSGNCYCFAVNPHEIRFYPAHIGSRR